MNAHALRAALLALLLLATGGCRPEQEPVAAEPTGTAEQSLCTSCGAGCVSPCGTCNTKTCTCVPAALSDGLACNDGQACTAKDHCVAGFCVGITSCNDATRCVVGACDATGNCSYTGTTYKAAGTYCDDQETCTTASACDGAGRCLGTANAALGTACDDLNDCTTSSTCDGAGNCLGRTNATDLTSCTVHFSRLFGCGSTGKCYTGVCRTCYTPGPCQTGPGTCTVGLRPTCSYPIKTDGTVCNDGLTCTSSDHCSNGQCVGNPVNGGGCDDANTCTVNDRCQSGVCTGTAVTCTNPPDPKCYNSPGTCSGGACSYTKKTDNTACDDGNLCTVGERCLSGVCTPVSTTTCSALDQCHNAGSCDPASGACSNPPKPDGTLCDDGKSNTSGDRCLAGVCTPTTVTGCTTSADCPAAGQCQLSVSCNTSNGQCVYTAKGDGTGCNDGNACTSGDHCQGGVCIYTSAVSCPAPDQCHDNGTCDPVSGNCLLPEKLDGTGCSDGDPCSLGDSCISGVCTPVGFVACDPIDQCHLAGTCDSATGLCSTPPADENSPCDDQSLCTVGERCVQGVCTPASTVVCAALDQCHDIGSCDPATGECSTPLKADGAPCDDGLSCTLDDSCQGGACQPARDECTCTVDGDCSDTPNDCKKPRCLERKCTVQDEVDGAGCDDANPCTESDRCGAGACQGTAVADGTPCPAGQCVAGKCTVITEGGSQDHPDSRYGCSCSSSGLMGSITWGALALLALGRRRRGSAALALALALALPQVAAAADKPKGAPKGQTSGKGKKPAASPTPTPTPAPAAAPAPTPAPEPAAPPAPPPPPPPSAPAAEVIAPPAAPEPAKPSGSAPRKLIRLAFLGVSGGAGVEEAVANSVSEYVQSRLVALGAYEVVGQSEVAAMVGLDRQRRLLGCSESDCLTEVAGALAAERALSGSLAKVGDSFLLNLSLLDTKKSRPIGRVGRRVVGTSVDPLLDLVSPALVELVQQDPRSGEVKVAQPDEDRGFGGVLAGVRGDADALGGGLTGGVQAEYSGRMLGIAGAVLAGKTSPAIRLEGRLYPLELGRVRIYLGPGITAIAPAVAARAVAGADVRLGHFHLFADAAYERFFNNQPSGQGIDKRYYRSDAVLVGVGTGWVF